MTGLPPLPATAGDLLLGLDVGATHTRAQLARRVEGRLQPPGGAVSRPVGSKPELAGFVRELIEGLGQERPRAAAVGMAGAVLAAGSVRVTNWPGTPTVDLGDLASWGLPVGRTRLVNDMEIAGAGLFDLVDRSPSPYPDCVELYRPDGAPLPGHEPHRVLVIPGTGLGTLGLVTVRGDDGRLYRRHLPSEVAHAPAAPLDAEHLELLRRLAAEDGGRWPSWEDFASGRGLVRLHRELGRLRGVPAPQEAEGDTAAAIARRGVDGGDPLAAAALDVYYRAVARVAQILALVYQPRGGIFLAGRSCRLNRAVIERGRFVETLQDNPAQAPLLARFPVFLVLAELNLRGALQLAGEALAS